MIKRAVIKREKAMQKSVNNIQKGMQINMKPNILKDLSFICQI
jgi:hypothetical protein